MREILILGGGASGLAAAIGAAQTGGGGVRVTLVEQNPAPGKKTAGHRQWPLQLR